MQVEPRGLLCRGAGEVPPREPGNTTQERLTKFGDTTKERLLLEEVSSNQDKMGSFQGPVPEAQRGQGGFLIGDFHGNRLGGAAKVKRER